MPGEPVQIGPFLGGLNTFSDPTALADNQLVVCENFELDLDGSLVSRPPFSVVEDSPFPLSTVGDVQLLGFFFADGNVPYLIANNGSSSTLYWDGSGWEVITSNFAASAMTQFDGKAWLLAPQGEFDPGGYWTPLGGFTAAPNMPKGDAIVSFKSRLWIVPGKNATSNPTRLYYSEVQGVSPLWPVAPDFIDVGSGDGQAIVGISAYYSSLLLFRTNSIYTLQYVSDPAQGSVTVSVPGVGLTDKNCLVAFENYIYFMYDDKAYEFVNNRASQLNIQVPFRSDVRTNIYQPFSVSKFNRRIIFTYWDRMFVFNLRTRTWTTWRSTQRGTIGRIIDLDDGTGDYEAFAFSSTSVPEGGSREAAMLRIIDGFNASNSETFDCTLQTKNYNYEIGSKFKRLFWWGVEAVFRGEIYGQAVPINYTLNGTWGQLLASTWGALLNQTWGALTFDSYTIETTRDTTGTGALRKFVKFRKSTRFRQLYFRVVFESDGTTQTSPVRLFLLLTHVSAKQTVSQPVS
jgi:hypothetical protein